MTPPLNGRQSCGRLRRRAAETDEEDEEAELCVDRIPKDEWYRCARPQQLLYHTFYPVARLPTGSHGMMAKRVKRRN